MGKVFTVQQKCSLVQIESICRWQNKYYSKIKIWLLKRRKHYRKRRKWSPAFSPFPHNFFKRILYERTRLGGSVVSMSDSWPGGCEFDPRLRRLFFLAYFRLSPLQKHVRKVVGGFERKVVLVLVWERQETHMRHRPPWYDLSC